MTAFAAGAPCWADVMLSDLEAGKRFYGELFGWTFSEAAPEHGNYTVAFKDGRAAAGLMPKRDGRMPTAWSVYFATPDAARTSAAILRAGGRIVAEARPVGDLGTLLVAADPTGAVFSVWQPGIHQGFGVQGEPGAYVWTGLSTRDTERADAFYGEVFGFESVADSPASDERFRPWRLAGQGREIGGRALMDDYAPAEMPPHFTVCFLVPAMDDAVHTTTRLGGRITVEPVGTPGGPFAVFTDNQGAGFGVMAPK
ncbi:hydrolase [Streptomyces sp. CB02923]|uniref:VOC family protein n=1 Tax=Streptomyces sp. CB02923 TaxID=1718985 RepID=UPI0009394EC3|nr:VOC family protein [Streptomyces sp. CB02923]OKI03116.1 hydrolase [Streptomyces sp. CB02923]